MARAGSAVPWSAARASSTHWTPSCPLPAGGAALVLAGRPGVGVSALLGAAARDARARGHRVLTVALAAADAGSQGGALRRIATAARRVDTAGGPAPGRVDSPNGRVPGPAGGATPDPSGGGGGPGPGCDLGALLDRLAARRPVTVVLDNAHWLDPASDAALVRLVPQLAGVVLLAGRREPSAALRDLPTLPVRPLDAPAAAALLDARATGLAPPVHERILADAAGHPLAIEELPSCWRAVEPPGGEVLHRFAPLSTTLLEAFTHGADRLPREAAGVLLAAALADDDELAVALAAASRLAGRPVTVAALEPAVACGLVSVVDGRVLFAHALTRAGLAARAALTDVAAAHAALADVLAAQPFRAVWHEAHAVAGPDEDVAARLAGSGEEAERLGQPVEALRRWQRAARLTPDPDRRAGRHLGAATVAFELGRPDVAFALLGTAERVARDPAREALAAGLEARFAARPGRWHDPVTESCRLARRHADRGEHDAALDVLGAAAHAMFWSAPPDDERVHLAGAFGLLSRAPAEPRYVAALSAVDPDAAMPLARALVAAAPRRDVRTLRLLATAAVNTGDPATAADLFACVAGPLRASGRLGVLTHVQGLHARAAATLGDWPGAADLAGECALLATRSAQPLWHAHALATLALVAALTGDATARERVERVERGVLGQRVTLVTATTQLARAVGLLSAQQWTEGYAAVRSLFDATGPAYHRQHLPEAATFLAEAAVGAGRVADARAVVATLRPTTPAARRALAVALAMLAEPDEAPGRFADAAALDLAAWPWLRARLDLSRGVWLRRVHRAVDARAPLRAAWDRFGLLGAPAWAARAKRELRAAGADVGDPACGAAGVLSPQELEIAGLAATGLSNREIGQRLFLSPRTVGSHLYRIFPKLGITSRAQLSARLP